MELKHHQKETNTPKNMRNCSESSIHFTLDGMVHLQSFCHFFVPVKEESCYWQPKKMRKQKETFHQNYITKNMSLHQIMDFPPISN